MIIVNGRLLAVNYYHKVLRLRCCSIPISASGKVYKLTGMIKKMSVSKALDRCRDDFTKINEVMVVDQTGSHQLMENRPEDEAGGYSKEDQKIH